MQTEIDKFLIEQTSLLSQQINSLKNIVLNYQKIEQQQQQKISNLEVQTEQQKEIISALKAELLTMQQASFSEDLQESLNNNLQKQVNQSLTALNLNLIIKNLIYTEFQTTKTVIEEQQNQLSNAISLILKTNISTELSERIELQNKQVSTISTRVEDLINLVNNLKD